MLKVLADITLILPYYASVDVGPDADLNDVPN